MLTRFLPVFFLALGSGAAAQQIRFVNQLASGANSGQTWNDAFTNLDVALAASVAGDDLFVMTGAGQVYVPLASSGFALPVGVDLFGGFTSASQLTTSARPRSANGLLTALSDLAGAGALHVLNLTGAGSGTNTVDGFIARGGNANGTGVDSSGGGIVIAPPAGSNRLVQLTELSVLNNSAVTTGGGLFASSVFILRMRRVHLNENTAGLDGGALFLSQGFQFRSDDCVFDGNSAGRNGGGVFITATNLAGNGQPLTEFENALFHHNGAAFGSGGGAFLDGSGAVSGKAAFRHCTFSLNDAGVRGGGVFAMTTTAVKAVSLIENSIVFQNTRAGTIVDELGGRQACSFSDCPSTGQGCFYLDPQFVVDPLFGTAFDIASSSPCATAGNPTFSGFDLQDLDLDLITVEPLSADFANVARPTGGASVSVGAYEP